jgi:hypothetical protein
MSLIVNSSLVSSPSDPLLASDSTLIKWRPVLTSPLPLSERHSLLHRSFDTFGRLWFLGKPCGDHKCQVPLLAREPSHWEYLGVHCPRYCLLCLHLSLVLIDLNSSSYLIYVIEESSARRLSPGVTVSATRRSLSSNVISIPANSTISVRNLRNYVPGISDQHLYILRTGIV